MIANFKNNLGKLKYWLIAGACVGFAAYHAVHFLFPTYHIKGSSMHPLVTDGALVNATFSLSDPEVGQIFIVNQSGKHFVKRLVGKPGDTLSFNLENGMLINRNGKPVQHVRDDEHQSFRLTSTREETKGASFISDAYRIVLNGVEHAVYGPNNTAFADDEKLKLYTDRMFHYPWLESQTAAGEATVTFTLPDGQFFVLSDNRVGSEDSRQFGPVDESALIYRVVL